MKKIAEKEAYEQYKSSLKKETKDCFKPPPIPLHFQNPSKLFDEQLNFYLWNPHIFPDEVNKAQIHYFRQRIEEEAKKSSYNVYMEFEGLEDEESQSPMFADYHSKHKEKDKGTRDLP